MTTRFCINEAIASATLKGIKVRKIDLAVKLWADRPEAIARVNMTTLCSGKRKRIDPAWVGIVCDVCQCTPNQLFGIEPFTTAPL